MYSKLTSVAIFMWLSLTACSERENGFAASEEKVAVSFAAGITTRVVDTNWEQGDKIGISMLNAGSNNITGEVFNRQYLVTGPGSLSAFLPFTPHETIFYPVDDSKVQFLAYYPYSRELKSLNDFPISVTNQVDRKVIDLMVARTGTAGRESPNVELVFRHHLASLEFTIEPGDVGSVENLDGATLKVKNIPVAASCNLYTGAFTPLDYGDIAVNMSGNGTKGRAIVLPREPGNEVWLEYTLTNGTSFKAYVDAKSRWESGICYVYTITLRKKPVPVDLSVSVTEWASDNQQGKLE